MEALEQLLEEVAANLLAQGPCLCNIVKKLESIDFLQCNVGHIYLFSIVLLQDRIGAEVVAAHNIRVLKLTHCIHFLDQIVPAPFGKVRIS